MTLREFQLEPSALENISMNPDDLERNPVGAKCVGKFFYDLEFCTQDFEFLNDPFVYEFQLATCRMKIVDESMRRFEC